jgi:FkbM family methyltransferase
MTRMPRFTAFEVVLISVFVALVTYLSTFRRDLRTFESFWTLARYPLEERGQLEKTYGPHTNAIGVDEWVIRDYFQDRRDGVFLDVGASHYQEGSNTYYLEHYLGWSGVAIEAMQEFAAGYAQHRPRTRFVAMFASDRADDTAQLFVSSSNQFVASVSQASVERESAGGQGVARSVPTTTLNRVLEQAGVTRIDLLNMDIELSEPKALAGFDVGRYRPELVCIEAQPETRQQILDYFDEHGYQLVGKYLRVDPTNLYFRPGTTTTPDSLSTR